MIKSKKEEDPGTQILIRYTLRLLTTQQFERASAVVLASELIRKKIIETSATANIPHLGSCLSCVDLLVYLYWIEMTIDPLKPNDSDRDRFVLSKGHGAPALFQV